MKTSLATILQKKDPTHLSSHVRYPLEEGSKLRITIQTHWLWKVRTSVHLIFDSWFMNHCVKRLQFTNHLLIMASANQSRKPRHVSLPANKTVSWLILYLIAFPRNVTWMLFSSGIYFYRLLRNHLFSSHTHKLLGIIKNLTLFVKTWMPQRSLNIRRFPKFTSQICQIWQICWIHYKKLN